MKASGRGARPAGLRAIVLFACCLAFALAGHAPRGKAHEQLVMKVVSTEVPDSPTGNQLRAFRDWVHEATNGMLRVKLLLSGRLGSAAQLAARTREGSVQAMAGTAHELSAGAPALEVLEAPFLFPLDTKRTRSLLDGPLRRHLQSALPERGLAFAMWCPSDHRHWFGPAPLTTRESFAQLAVRSRPGRAASALLQWLGTGAAEPAPAAPGSAGHSGFPAVDDTVVRAVARGAHLEASHLTLTGHAFLPRLLVYSQAWYAGLPEQLQETLREPPPELVEQGRKDLAATRTTVLASLRAAGLAVHELGSRERAALAQGSGAVRSALAAELGPAAQGLLQSAR